MNIFSCRGIAAGRSNINVVARNFAQKAKKKPNKTFRVRPFTRDDRPIIQKQRKINEEHEQLAEGLGLPFRILGAT